MPDFAGKCEGADYSALKVITLNIYQEVQIRFWKVIII